MTASLAGNLAGTLSGAGSSNIQGMLQGAGITGDTLQTAVTSLTGLDTSAQNTVLGLAGSVESVASSGISMNTVAPLIAAGFAATGVGAPIAAAITLGLPMVEGLANALDPPPKYAWGFRPPNYGTPSSGKYGVPMGTKVPYGPADPSWKSYKVMIPLLLAVSGLFGKGLDDIIPGLAPIEAERESATNRDKQTFGLPAGIVTTFRKVYDTAWEKNYEYILNGHNWVDPYSLLTTIANAWNATHQATSHYTFSGNTATYIDKLIAGNIDGQDHPPVTINTGAAFHPAPSPTPQPTAAQKQMAAHLHVQSLAPATVAQLQSANSITAHLVHWPWWPYVPAAAGVALSPVLGVGVAALGIAASAIWKGLTR